MSSDCQVMPPAAPADDRYQRLFDDLYHMGIPDDIFVEPGVRGIRRSQLERKQRAAVHSATSEACPVESDTGGEAMTGTLGVSSPAGDQLSRPGTQSADHVLARRSPSFQLAL